MELHDGAASRTVMEVVDVLRDQTFQLAQTVAAGPLFFQPGKRAVGVIGFRFPEVVVEDLLDHRPCLFRVRKERVELKHARVIRVPQAAGAAKRWDPAFDADPRAGERSQVPGKADEGGGGMDGVLVSGDDFGPCIR